MNNEALLQKYLTQIDLQKYHTKKLFVVGMVGVTGAGKSTLSRALAERLGLYIASNDHVRRFLNQEGYGFEGDGYIQEAVQFIVENLSRFLYEHHISHVIDADLVKFHTTARENARKFGADFFLVHVVARDADVKKRIAKRMDRLAKGKIEEGFSKVGMEGFELRKRMHKELGIPPVDFTVDSSKDTVPQVEAIVDYLKREGYVD